MRALAEEDFPRRRVGLLYRAAILLVAFAMLLLPCIYAGVVGLVGWYVYWHATWIDIVKNVRPIWVGLFLYIGPIFVGAVLFFFLVKPFFARFPKTARIKALDFAEQPVIHTVVARIAEAVGAPEPRRIELDCQVNASARMGNGFFKLFRRDLVLTIGLPLVHGLSVEQLAGVVAHELGHFAQGAGMRLSYVIRSINAWFARAVYERDHWDEKLIQGAEEEDRLAWLFGLARFCVEGTRGILWVFMMIGHGISCLLLRQMEYDADRYEAHLVGGTTFEQTQNRLLMLDIGWYGALAVIDRCLDKQVLPDHFAEVVTRCAGSIPAKQQRKFKKRSLAGRTGLFDTHPSPQSRLACVRREDASGVFHFPEPATVLFKDYDRLSRAVTLAFYRRVFGKRVGREHLIPVEEVFSAQVASQG